MKYHDDHRIPHHRTILAALALLVASFLAPTLAVYADPPTVEEEIALERSCEEWQKVRRCLREDGEIGLECASKSPFAHFLSFFHSRSEDDEVHVAVVRNAPDDTTGHPAASADRHETTGPQGHGEAGEAGEVGETTVARHSERKVDKRAETRVVERSNDRASHRKVVRTGSDLPRCEGGI